MDITDCAGCYLQCHKYCQRHKYCHCNLQCHKYCQRTHERPISRGVLRHCASAGHSNDMGGINELVTAATIESCLPQIIFTSDASDDHSNAHAVSRLKSSPFPCDVNARRLSFWAAWSHEQFGLLNYHPISHGNMSHSFTFLFGSSF